jgi:hypothetical protein
MTATMDPTRRSGFAKGAAMLAARPRGKAAPTPASTPEPTPAPPARAGHGGSATPEAAASLVAAIRQ